MNFARAVLVLVDLLHVMITVLVIAGNHVVVTVLFRTTILHVIHVSSTVVWVENIQAVQVMVAVHVTEALSQVLAVAVEVLQILAKVNVSDSAKVVRMIVLADAQTTVKQNVQMTVRVTAVETVQRPAQIIVRVALPIVRTIVG